MLKFYLAAVFFTLLLSTEPAAGFRVCGNFCGPAWCNARVLDESECDGSVEPDPDYPAVDGCCRQHDLCCGHGNRSRCNGALVACIQKLYDVPLADNRFETAYDWIRRYFQYPVACGTRVIGEFFDIMGILAHLVYDEDMCCATPCAKD